MGNRIDEESVCMRCGGVVINIDPALKMCSNCEKEVTEEARRKIANRKNPPKHKRIRLKLPKLAGVIRVKR